jgi:Ca-activated chloride channel family protein
MSDSQPTADDYRDRLVDRVLTEALGDERPPDLSPVIAQRVADAQAEVASTTQGRVVMQSRRVWITLLATAASLMGVAFVWQANERREAMEVATAAVVRAEAAERQVSELETQVASREDTIHSLAAEQRKFIGRNRTLTRDSGGSTPQPSAVPVANGATESSISDATVEGWTIGIQDGPVAGRYNSTELAAAPATPALKPGQSQTYSISPEQVEELKSLRKQPATPAQQPPRSGANGSPSASKDDLRWFEPVELDKNGRMPRRDSNWFSSTDKLYWSESKPSTAIGLGGLINDATAPSNGPFGFSGGGEWPGRVRPNGLSGSSDRYEPIHENAFVKPVGEDALSTFSIDVDTASYANVRQYLRDMRQMPPADAVRIEELVNYFDYGYEAPQAESEEPFAANLGCSVCPWKPEHKLVRIGVKGREVAVDKRPLSNLVFLIDVSGSMNEWNKLPLVISGLKALVTKLGENDRVAIVVYAGSEGLVLPSTGGDQKEVIRAALDRLTAGGSTAGGAGLRLAYEIAERNKIVGGVNRVVLCTDGDFNVGMTGTEEIAQFVETRAKETNVYLTVLGFGRGNLNDAMLEQISGRGDGNYAYIDDFKEAHRVLSSDLSKTLVAIAKDVKMQVEFNPKKVASYRLIGYENRVMAAEDFNNDAKDAGDIGAGHTVTALYEVVPVGVEEPAPAVDGLKYQADAAAVEDDAAHTKDDADRAKPTAFADELLTLKIRYKQPEGGASKKIEFPLEDGESDKSVAEADADFRWAAAVAEFGMLLRNSRHVGDGSFDAVLELARGAIGDDPQGYRAEFVDLVRRAKEVSGR